MAISLKHSFQSAKADGADTSLVRPSDWNAEHTLTQATNRLLGRTTAGTGATEEISVGSGLTFSAGSLSAAVTSVAGKTGAVTLAAADVSGAAPTASPALTGTPTAPTAAVDTNTTQIATTAYVIGQDYLKRSGGSLSGVLNINQTGSIFPASFKNTGTTASDHAIIFLGTSTTGTTASISGLYFGDADSSTQGQIRYTHSTDAFTFFTNGSVRATLGSGGLLTLSSGSGLAIASTAVTSPAAADGNVFSGTYTPTANGTHTNIASISFGACQYIRVGNTVTVSGLITVSATSANTATVARFSIPISSTFSSVRHLCGAGGSSTATYGQGGAALIADTTNMGVDMRFTPTATTSTNWSFTFTYQVI